MGMQTLRVKIVDLSRVEACHGRGDHHSFALDGKALRTIGISFSQMDAWRENAYEKKRAVGGC